MDTTAQRIIIAGSQTPSTTQLLTLLDRLGYDAFAAENGEQVLVLLETLPANLVIFDGHLPARDVVATQEQIKRHPQWSKIPLIMMAARHSKTAHNEYIRFGYEGLLTTPFDLRQMHTLIQEFLATGETQKRHHARIRFKLPVTLTHNENSREYQPLNLSEGGIYLKTERPLPVGTVVDLCLPLPGASPLKLTGLVVYQKGSSSEVRKAAPGMAIKFQKSAGLVAVAVADYISGILLEDLPAGTDSIISKVSRGC